MIFKVIVFTVIALAGIGLLLSVVTTIAPNFTGPVMCGVYQAVMGIMPVPEESKPPLPWYCTSTRGCEMQRKELSSETPDALAEEMADYLVNCWECSERGEEAQTFTCYELYTDLEVEEREVTEKIKEKGMCGILPNNVLDADESNIECGSGNKIYWDGDKLRETIIVKYDSFRHRLLVS